MFEEHTINKSWMSSSSVQEDEPYNFLTPPSEDASPVSFSDLLRTQRPRSPAEDYECITNFGEGNTIAPPTMYPSMHNPLRSQIFEDLYPYKTREGVAIHERPHYLRRSISTWYIVVAILLASMIVATCIYLAVMKYLEMKSEQERAQAELQLTRSFMNNFNKKGFEVISNIAKNNLQNEQFQQQRVQNVKLSNDEIVEKSFSGFKNMQQNNYNPYNM